jgi:ABC-type phosphate transport system substrate-binding protein
MKTMAHKQQLALIVLLAVGSSALRAGAQDGDVQVIVNASNPGVAILRQDLAALFLRKATRWGFGTPAEPVDQSFASPIRAVFCRDVLKEALPAVQKYWQQQIFSGRSTPPRVKASDAEVIAFVVATEGGVGYVSASTPLPDGVKVLRVEESK